MTCPAIVYFLRNSPGEENLQTQLQQVSAYDIISINYTQAGPPANVRDKGP